MSWQEGGISGDEDLSVVDGVRVSRCVRDVESKVEGYGEIGCMKRGGDVERGGGVERGWRVCCDRGRKREMKWITGQE